MKIRSIHDDRIYAGDTAGEVLSVFRRNSWRPEKTKALYRHELLRRLEDWTGVFQPSDAPATIILEELCKAGIIEIMERK